MIVYGPVVSVLRLPPVTGPRVVVLLVLVVRGTPVHEPYLTTEIGPERQEGGRLRLVVRHHTTRPGR